MNPTIQLRKKKKKMAQIQFQPKFHSIFKKDFSLKYRILQPSNVLYIKRSNKKIGRLMVRCCCSSSSSFPVSLTRGEEEVGLKVEVGKERGDYEVDCFVNEHGWKVRRMNETKEEMRKVAAIQAEAFHKPTSFDFFKAKLLSGLVNRLRNSPPDRYACLVAEPSSDNPEVEQDIVGVVNATVLRDKDVLHYFPEAEEYLYISGIAVLNQFRRQKVATALLKACDVLARFWGFDYLALRAYEGDFGARQLYTNAGYSVVSSDPLWKSTLIGRRRRVLMIKHVSLDSANIH